MHEKGNNCSTGSATEYVATFYLNDATHGRRQQLRDLALANNSLQEWYRMEELLERSPTLPRTNQTTTSNDGNSPKKLTVNSALGFEKQRSIIWRISLTGTLQPADAKNQLLNSQQRKSKRCRNDLTKRRRTAYVIISAISWSPKNHRLLVIQTQATAAPHQSQATVTLTNVDICSQLDKPVEAASHPDASYSSAPPVASYSDVD
ncbi:hypothetical protein F511_15279 [Dorcoceras hygrometricum]|uniref:Uncharacterized protein n=1 Tax=Dorcoceras hygrometricum TaxID=472368 RepID=A0A2Z7AEE0_9LAMI|nr:hypothetical protein F511_15279 [Dorcoceras hygrometricum]